MGLGWVTATPGCQHTVHATFSAGPNWWAAPRCLVTRPAGPLTPSGPAVALTGGMCHHAYAYVPMLEGGGEGGCGTPAPLLVGVRACGAGKCVPMGCGVLGRGAEPLVRAQFLEHPPSLNFGANQLKNGFGTLKTPPLSHFFPQATLIVGVVSRGGGGQNDLLS